MSIINTTINIAIVGGVGYLAYDYYANGLCGGILKRTPLCATASIAQGFIGFFSNQVDVGIGVPLALDECPTGWSNDGLICREPISCASGWDFFQEGCHGGALVGRLDKQSCPPDHPDKIDLLCYRS